MNTITVTGLRVASTSGANKRPGSGDVTYSDGKTYSFISVPEVFGVGYSLSSWRKRYGKPELFSLRSPRREDALAQYLNN